MGDKFTDFIEEHKKTVTMHIQVSSIFNKREGVKQFYCANRYNSVLCTTPSSNYEIPSEIRELLKLPGFCKLYAEPITLELKHDTAIDHYVEEFCGIPWDRITCDACDHNMAPLEDKWVIPYVSTLCGMCYTALPNKDKYVLSHPSDFRISDWIQFMECDGGAFFVNCNPHHADYRKIIHRFVDVSVGKLTSTFDMVGKADELLALIQEWFALTPVSIHISSEKDLELYHYGLYSQKMDALLDSHVGNSDTIRTARRYGVVPPDGVPTFRMVLENRPKGVSDNIWHDEINRINYMRDLCIGTFYYDNLTDEKVSQIAWQMVVDVSKKPVFSEGDISYVLSNMSQHCMYEDPVLRSFSTWLFHHSRYSRYTC